MGVGNAVNEGPHDRAVRLSYIVHVYRRSDEPGHEVAGLIEPVEGGDALAFAGRDELWAALSRSDAPPVTVGRRRSKRDS